eukprot:374303_1
MALLLLIFIFNVWNINALGTEPPMELVLFPPNTSGHQCLDGSPSGYYYSPPPSGSCYTQSDCAQRANTTLGSSKNWSNIHYGNPALNPDPHINPDFYQGHH